MELCTTYNQYYTDVVDSEGKLITSKCFDGKIYNKMKDFYVNSYKNYKSTEYYL